MITIDLFARGGGGGSGGGGGGESIIVILGWFPTMFIGRKLVKHISKPIAAIVIAIMSVAYAFVWFAIGGIGIIIGLCALGGGLDGYFGWSDRLGRRVFKARKKLAEAASKDPNWDEQKILGHAQAIFLKFQEDWGKFNTDSMQTYMTPGYFRHMQLMMYAIKTKGRTNYLTDLKIMGASLVDVSDSDDNSLDNFTVQFSASAQDHLYDNRLQREIFLDKNPFIEEWRFNRNGDGWLLDGIRQSTENPLEIQTKLKEFATQNNMFYSPDMGWLLMPLEGDLFGEAKFGKSDINNHVIGVYSNVLTEVYTYRPQINGTKNYIVAQSVVPKTYGKLVVKHKSGGILGSAFTRTPKGLNKITLEWPDFNKRYDVFADNVEQVTAFELLHPVFMEKLFALDFPVNIEVADNVVYLYTNSNAKQDIQLYQSMFAILLDAYKEMKL